MKKICFSIILILFLNLTFSQNIKIKITDAQSNEPLPYATIKFETRDELITNDEGIFSLSEKQLEGIDKIKVSFMGYVSRELHISELKKLNHIIQLSPASFKLDNLTISNKKPDPLQIVTEAKNRLTSNYNFDNKTTKNKLFYRKSSTFKADDLTIDINKSTGFTKKQLKEANSDLQNFSSHLTSKPLQEYKDILCDYYYGSQKNKEGKLYFFPKLDVVKAVNIKGNISSDSFENIENSGIKILLKHLDSTKFYRIKSGLFGSRDTVTLNEKYNSKNEKKKASKTINTKFEILRFLVQQNFMHSKLDFITATDSYSYSLENSVFDDSENELIYVIKFKPLKNKAKYVGRIYINGSDYAIVKCNYKLAEGKKVSGFNLKFLLGVKGSENVNNGTILFKKNSSDKKYDIQYAYEENGKYFYVNRPLKFIELTKEDKDIVAMDIKIEGNSLTKTEILNINQEEISDTDFTNFKETIFDFIKLNQYDPEIWKNLISIEPSHVMKQYRTLDNF